MIEPEVLFETRWLGLYRIGHWDFAKRPNADACVVEATATAERLALPATTTREFLDLLERSAP